MRILRFAHALRIRYRSLAVHFSPLSIPFSGSRQAVRRGSQPKIFGWDRWEQSHGGGGLSSAALTGFRYLVQNRGANVAAAEVVIPSPGAAPVLANLNYGPYVEATAHALATAAGLAPVAQNSYEARLLRFSAIGLMALWLKPDSAGSDIIYPLAPAPSGLQAEQPYSAEAFFKIVRPLAVNRAGKKAPGSVP